MFWEYIGLAAATLTMFSFIPQIIRVSKTKSAKDVSPAMLIQLSFGAALWIAYGVYLRNVIIIFANSVTLCSLIILLFLYFQMK